MPARSSGEELTVPLRTVDMHSHFFPREWEDLHKRLGGADWPWMKHLGDEDWNQKWGQTPLALHPGKC